MATDKLNTPMIAPGCYKLSRDVGNPEPDRRQRYDWRKLPVWKAGWEFIVIEKNRFDHLDDEYLSKLPEETRTKLKVESKYTVVQLVGDRWPSSHEIGPGHEEQYAVLAEALVTVEESIEQMMLRIGAHREGFAAWLVETGKIDRKLFESWWNEYEHEGQG